MKNKQTVLLIALLGLVTTCNRQPQRSQTTTSESSRAKPATQVNDRSSVKPQSGSVPDEQAAIAIAVPVWIPIYGKEQLESEKPFRATLKGGVWTVCGSLPDGYDGGTAVAEIAQADGRVLRVIHYQ